MNYYERHLGDYAKDTGHLSMVEHGAYRRLLDRYYGKEEGIAPDQVYRITRARTRDEKQAVDVVLDEFFTIQNGTWISHKIERNIELHRRKLASLKDLQNRDEYRRFRDFVLGRDCYRCVYCGCTDRPLQLDHVIPRSRGGADSPDNLVSACKSCNTSKGAKTPEEWMTEIRA